MRRGSLAVGNCSADHCEVRHDSTRQDKTTREAAKTHRLRKTLEPLLPRKRRLCSRRERAAQVHEAVGVFPEKAQLLLGCRVGQDVLDSEKDRTGNDVGNGLTWSNHKMSRWVQREKISPDSSDHPTLALPHGSSRPESSSSTPGAKPETEGLMSGAVGSNGIVDEIE